MALPENSQNAGIAQRKPEKGVAQVSVRQPSCLAGSENQKLCGSRESCIQWISTGCELCLLRLYSSTIICSRSQSLGSQPTNTLITLKPPPLHPCAIP